MTDPQEPRSAEPLSVDMATTERERIQNLLTQYLAGLHTLDEMPDLLLASLDTTHTLDSARETPAAGLDGAEHVAHRGNHEGYACGFSGPHCWACNEPWPCRAERRRAALGEQQS